ncbi:glyoxalase/bleomycin resistance protein/dioxygenase [Streptomyces sp. CBMAI 2042]|uniref:VOC family protein n=1 Tax=Streptomyces sp. CBMAI 2042 TaxID=2305222 RepID=UPI000F219B76|nr:VOC family protein [Streptomyces sp. CBMAI 2042]RLV71148.1 glyoxalase/bleomycin resistance protein/dioxygenase [Streptomyces sp. CBMAI 2042]
MGSRLNPYISFDANARQAMKFYQEVFGGELEVSTAADFGSANSGSADSGPADASDADKVLHARLDTPDGCTVMAWDVPEGVPYHPGNDVAVYLGGDDTELRVRFERLSEGGTVTMPLEKQPWGDEAGVLVDRFGITWMVNIGQG